MTFPSKVFSRRHQKSTRKTNSFFHEKNLMAKASLIREVSHRKKYSAQLYTYPDISQKYQHRTCASDKITIAKTHHFSFLMKILSSRQTVPRKHFSFLSNRIRKILTLPTPISFLCTRIEDRQTMLYDNFFRATE